MTRLQQKPIVHGRDHLPGHPDPIPGLILGPAGSFNTAVLATTDLLAYWRLGETGSPWADTSGIGTPDNLTTHESGTAPTPDVTGALPAGQDDGAIEFNYDGTDSIGGRYLGTAGAAKDFDLAELTVAAWVKVKASAATRRGVIAGTSTIAVGVNNRTGYGLQVMYPGRTVRFTIGGGPTSGSEQYAETAGGVVVGDWNFFCGTYDGTTIRLYANGAQVDETTSAGPCSSPGTDFKVGFGYGDYVAFSAVASWLYGTVDEAAVWTRALTAGEISALYNSGVEGATSGSQVLLSDGAGGTYWGQASGDAIEDEAIVNRHVAVGADIDVLKLAHPGGTSSFLRADGTWAAPSAYDPATATQAWMPLVDSDGLCVLDSGDTLIPTLITL